MSTMMKRRQASPTRARQHPVLPEVVQDEDDKISKSNQPSFASIKRALAQISFSWRALLLSCSFLLFLTKAKQFLILYFSHNNEKRPITIQTIQDGLTNGIVRLELTNTPEHLIVARENHYWIDHGTHYHEPPYYDDEEEDDKCEYMGDWQTERNIFACNPFHEINFQSPTLFNVGAGSYRDAWAFDEYDGTQQVIKTLVWNKHLDWDDWESARKEAMAMAQVGASPYVASIYGACSHSTIIDYSEDGILWWLFDDFEPTKNELLQIAHDVARGVADAQNVDEHGRATICHMDIKANQFILINGTYKINDFNMCEFLKWDPEENEYCSFEGGYVGRWQAPEHIGRRIMLDDEKSDVFSLGYVLYFLLTGDQQWASDSSDKAARWASKGSRPEIPERIRKSTHPFDVAACKAIAMSLRQEPKDRPTAREIADFLHNALVNAGLKDGPLQITDERDAEEKKEENGQDDQADEDEQVDDDESNKDRADDDEQVDDDESNKGESGDDKEAEDGESEKE